jgi:hypothetical protein
MTGDKNFRKYATMGIDSAVSVCARFERLITLALRRIQIPRA